jgi:hypothetical protein
MLVAAAIVALHAAPGAAHWLAAQARPVSSLSGEVVDAATGEPLSDVVLRLELAVPHEGRRNGELTAVTSERGRYRFEGVEPGRYRLGVERLGFRPAQLRVEIGGSAESRVSVGLELEPIQLDPVRVWSDRTEPYDRRMSNDVNGAGQAAAVEMRQRRYLPSDVRSLTHGELLAAVTLGESDLFRAMQRLPGVSTRDEWTAELWTRGTDWDQTRVWFDGLPLFNPLHGAGVLSGVNADGVGAVYLHPGVAPSRIGEGAAVLELQSRPAGGRGDLRGAGELSLASARVTMDQRLADGRAGWMFAARRTYLDWFTAGLEDLLNVDDAYVPYRFTDMTARFDRAFDNDVSIEASVLHESDKLSGQVPDVIHHSRIDWGNFAIRATVDMPFHGHRLRHTAGYTGYGVDSDTTGFSESTGGLNAPRAASIDHTVRYVVVRSELSPSEPGADGWSAGIELTRQTMRAFGEMPPTHLEYRATEQDSIDARSGISTMAMWFERRMTAGRFEFDFGMRAELGTRLDEAGGARLAPRSAVRFTPTDGLSLSVAAGRSWQYTQSIAPIGYFRSDFPSGQLWLMAGDGVPALRSDAVTLGGELRLADAWLLSATAWARGSKGVLIPDPRPGVTVDRPLYVAVDQTGRGAEVGVRRIRGRLTGAIGWTVGRTRQRFGDLEFPGRADRTHEIDATALYRLGPGLRLGGAFTWATGSPFTRVVDLEASDAFTRRVGVLAEPNAGRTPSYASLDLLLDWMKSFDTWRFGAFLQMRNALGRDNTATYTGTFPYCRSDGYTYLPDGGVLCQPDGSTPVQRDEFLIGLPRIPLIGFRVEF